ncbi:MAG: hypothetical protein QOI55_800 [Actinomycetota bacterium]|nr:hypothetical protein [Actinomycetota bacterium]
MARVRATLPVHPVDLAPFREGGAAGRLEVARRVDEACRDSGFLVVTGHGVSQATCDTVLDRFGAFFDLPIDEKRSSVVADASANRGYSELGKEALAYSRGEATPPDLFEAFNVGREDTVGPYFDRQREFFAPNVWPRQPAGLRETWLAYEQEVSRVADVLLRAMALALDLPEPWFVDRCLNAVITTRAINYERSPGAPAPESEQMRMGAHTDYGIVTVLLADDVAGLQVFRGGTWHDVPTPRDAFVCNIGDMLERWTNNRWTSTLHRVVPPPANAAGAVRRRSIARFLDCPPDLVVECIPSCCPPEPRYPPVVAGEWLRAKVLGGRSQRLPDLPT